MKKTVYLVMGIACLMLGSAVNVGGQDAEAPVTDEEMALYMMGLPMAAEYEVNLKTSPLQKTDDPVKDKSWSHTVGVWSDI